MSVIPQPPLPASLLRRLGSMLYDSLLLIALWMVTAGIITLLNAGESVQGAWFQSLLFLETYLFFTWCWGRGGATLGMQAWRLKVHVQSGTSFSPRQALIRFLVSIIGFAALGLGYWWILIDPARRSWGDIASRSQILYCPAEQPAS